MLHKINFYKPTRIFLYLIIMLTTVGCSSDDKIIKGEDLSADIIKNLQENNIISTDEKIHLYYFKLGEPEPLSSAILSDEAKDILKDDSAPETFVEYRNFFTNKQVVTYKIDLDSKKTSISSEKYENISDIYIDKMEIGGGYNGLTITISVKEKDSFKFVLLSDAEDDAMFAEELYSTWRSNPENLRVKNLVDTGAIPSDNLIFGESLQPEIKSSLQAEGILSANEKVEFYFTPKPLEFLMYGNILTDNKIISYRRNKTTQEREIHVAEYENISDIINQYKYIKQEDGSYILNGEKSHLQIFVDDNYSFGFDIHSDPMGTDFGYYARRLWQDKPQHISDVELQMEELIPDDITPITGEQIPEKVIAALVAENIIKQGEEVHYFHTRHPRSFKQFGTLFTDKRVIDYEVSESEQKRIINSLDYKKISHIQLEKDSISSYDSRIHIFVDESYQFSLEAPIENGNDEAIHKQLSSLWESQKNTNGAD